MAMNFSKEGYSTGEVGQILGCSQTTVWNMVNRGEIKALIDQKQTRKVIRITRAALVEFLKGHQARYSKELLKSFGIGDEAEKQQPDSQDYGAVLIKDLGGTKAPTGAWADILSGSDKKTEPGTASSYKDGNRLAAQRGATMPPSKTPYNVNRPTNNATRNYNRYSCQILVNGRIAVGGISKNTAKNVVDCLMEDPYMRPQSIEVKFIEED